ncbi:hypothetical protein ACRALDRAFT_2050110 [Sodiomyces alcalophilus JCM 7366]|uniref:uncharacterized protein n=1 Tax=Sodiomyces alcalophilus JCM 7366 TaxID=591952 RepID=UPI0039B3CBEE
MPAVEYDGSRDGERHLRHQHSASSDHSRALIPMWDSSDPERAPPPLPLNPQSPSVSPRRGTSSAIQSAHANLAEKARENTNDSWPEKSLVRGSHHRRMESLQAGTVRDISLLLEGSQLSGPPSPTKSVERSLRPSTPSKASSHSMVESAPPEKESQVLTNSPRPGPSLTPILRPTVRRPHQSILGENTPPQSATMQALQNMQTMPAPTTKDSEPAPLQNVTNQSSSIIRVPESLDCVSNQILSLTNIATALQRDMSQLSRRSRDNAADLLSLKEATKARDEDIRKSLRDVLNNMHETTARIASRDTYNTGLYLDSRSHQASPPPLAKAMRPYSLPRIPSPGSFTGSIDRDSVATPSLCNSEPSTTTANTTATTTTVILEKVLRDMSTKDGQNLLLDRLSELSERLSGVASAARVEELVAQARRDREQAMVAIGEEDDHMERDCNSAQSNRQETGYDLQPLSASQRMQKVTQPGMDHRSLASDTTVKLLGDDMTKAIRSVKDIVSQSGGLTAEVKALVRELRGEVLGMGREIGRRLDELDDSQVQENDSSATEEIAKIVEEGLGRMKTQMDELIHEHQRLSATAVSSRPKEIDYHEIYNAMRAALRDADASKPDDESLTPEDVVDAVREAWDNYKPEYERNLGLGRLEILQYLTEGLQDHMQANSTAPGATKEEVFQAVVEGLKNFVPPRMDSTPSLSRDEILDAVRECLEEFEFPVAPSALNAELTREDMIYAVKQGLSDFDFPQQNVDLSHLPDSNEIALHLQEMMDYMRQEFQAASQDAKEDAAAIGRDTEQVLDATREGLEKLRCDMEAYVSHLLEESVRLQSQDDLADKLTETLDRFRDEIASTVAKASDDSRSIIEMRMDSLRDTVNSSMVPAAPQVNHMDILETVKSGLDAVRAEMRRPSAGHAEVLDTLHEGLADVRVSIEKISNKPADLTANDEILEALKTGLDGVHADIAALREQSREDQAVAIINDKAVMPAEPPDALCHDDIKNLEFLISELRNQVEALSPGATDSTAKEQVTRDDFARLEDMLASVKECMSEMDQKRETPPATDPIVRDQVTRDDFARLEDMLVNVQECVNGIDERKAMILSTDLTDSATKEPVTRDDFARLEDMLVNVQQCMSGIEQKREMSLATDSTATEHVTKDDFARLVDMLVSVQESVSGFDQKRQMSLVTDSTPTEQLTKDDIARLENMLGHVQECVNGMDQKRETALVTESTSTEQVTKDDFARLENMLGHVQECVNGMDQKRETPLPTDSASREDVQAIETILRNTKARLDDLIDGTDAVRREHVDNLESLIGETRDAVDMAVAQIDTLPRKDDITAVESLVTQVIAQTDTLPSKDDVTAVESLVTQVVAQFDTLPSKDAVTAVESLVTQVVAQFDTLPSKDAVTAVESLVTQVVAQFDTLPRKDDVTSVESLVTQVVSQFDALPSKDAVTAVESLVTQVVAQFDTLPRKDDVTSVGSLVTQVMAAFDEMKEREMTSLEDPERVTRTHVNAVETVCHDIKTVVENMVKTDLAALSSSEDVHAVKGVLDDLRARVDTMNESQSKASEDRQAEIVGVGERVSDVKTVLEGFQELVKGKLEDGVTGIEALSKLLEGISETVGQNANLGQNLTELSDMVRAEFEETKTGAVGAKLDTDEKLQHLTDDLGSKIDEKFAELVVKYEELQSLSEERAKAAEARDVETEAALLGSKTMAEELKSLVDTLGAAVTDSLEKMEEASRTVFDKVEEMAVKTDENHAQSTSEHHESQNQIKRAVETVEDLQGQLGDFQPKILDAVKDVLAVVGQHYEYSKTSTTDIQDKIEEAKPKDELKYDDTLVQEKLDKIVDHTHATEKALSQLDALEQIRQQVVSTASEISAFLAGQAKQIADANEDRERSLQETTIALERRLAEKEQVEANLSDLRAEEQRLKESVGSLRAEQETMTRQKTRLVADVSSIETALRLRREELQDMEARAQGLERRILDGIMDHSRVLLMSKAAKGKEAMSQKRVRGHKHNRATEGANPPAVNIALATRRNVASPAQSGPGRRILSLSHINNNVASGGVSRSQSVRTPVRSGRSLRKNSWGGSLENGHGDHDKENMSVREVDEETEAPKDSLLTVEDSMANMDAEEMDVRRSSHGTTIVTETLVNEDFGEEGEYGDEFDHMEDDGVEDGHSGSPEFDKAARDGQTVGYGDV